MSSSAPVCAAPAALQDVTAGDAEAMAALLDISIADISLLGDTVLHRQLMAVLETRAMLEFDPSLDGAAPDWNSAL